MPHWAFSGECVSGGSLRQILMEAAAMVPLWTNSLLSGRVATDLLWRSS
jgi:hypothetical protein